jgi:hypothetical protein
MLSGVISSFFTVDARGDEGGREGGLGGGGQHKFSTIQALRCFAVAVEGKLAATLKGGLFPKGQ